MAVPEPITRLEKYWAAILDKIQGGGSAPVLETLNVTANDTYTPPDYPDTPITREEQYLAAGLDGGDMPEPITREEQYLHEIATKMQRGGSSVTVEPLTGTQNGTTTAPSGTAYSPVTANVPNSYSASDEGKVVSNGALVAQTAHAPVTQNGTIDTTLNNSVTVNVSGGGALQVKTVILMPGETGSISPDSGYAGMSRVDYDVGPAPTIYRAERSTEIDGCVLYEFPFRVDSFVIGAATGRGIGLCFLQDAPYSYVVNEPEKGEIGNFQGDAYLFPIVNGTNPYMYPQYIYAISPD